MIEPTPFPYQPNGGETMRDTVRFSTDLRTSYGQREQRAQLRATPDGVVEFSVPMFDPVKVSTVLGMLWAHQTDEWVVPLWRYAVRTLTTLSGGETEIQCVAPVHGHGLEVVPWQVSPSAARPYIMLWQSESHWQVLRYVGIAGTRGWGADWDFSWGASEADFPDSVVVESGVQGFGRGWGLAWDFSWGHSVAGGTAWPAGCLLIPCRIASLDPSLTDSLESLEAAQGRYLWTIEEVGDSAGAGGALPAAATVYGSREVFALQPSRVSTPEKQDVAVISMDSTTGPRTTETQSRTPTRGRELLMPAFDLAACYALRSFVYRVAGRARAFWVPSWQRDFVLSSGASIGASSVQIKECGYATNVFPVGPERRYVGFLGTGGAIQILRIETATTNGTVETLGLDTPLTVAVTTDTLAMYMRYARLDNDETAFEWDGGACFVKLQMRDVSGEIA